MATTHRTNWLRRGSLDATQIWWQITPDDTRLQIEYRDYPFTNSTGKLRGYLAKPYKVSDKLPAVLVLHEGHGLDLQTEDIVRRLALNNFIVFAPDAALSLETQPKNDNKTRELFWTLDSTKTEQFFFGAADILKKHPDSNGKVGAVGFSYEGGTYDLDEAAEKLAWRRTIDYFNQHLRR